MKVDKCNKVHRKQLTGRAVAAAKEELWIGRTSTAVKGELYWWRLLLFMLFGCRLFMFMVTLNFVQRSGIHICSNSNSVQERAGVLKLKSSDTLALTRGEIKRRPNCNLSLKNTETLQLHKRSHLSGPPL